jgi:hypothetical protein
MQSRGKSGKVDKLGDCCAGALNCPHPLARTPARRGTNFVKLQIERRLPESLPSLRTFANIREQARAYYAKEFADYRRRKPTPYMEKLRFTPQSGGTGDADVRLLSDDELKRAETEGTSAAPS